MIVERRIERTLDPVSLWVAASEEPVLVKVHNVQHLATAIRAQLADPVPAVGLVGRLCRPRRSVANGRGAPCR